MKKTKILITGANGFLGTRFIVLFKAQFTILALKHKSYSGKQTEGTVILSGDITKKNIIDQIKHSGCDIILHFAAKTHIDECEKDRILKENGDAWKVNVTGTQYITEACKKFGKKLIFLSTECIFDGERGNYEENDKPNPINWYGTTKNKAELIIQDSLENFCIIRAVLAYGHPKSQKYDMTRLICNSLKKNPVTYAVNDQFFNFTFIDDLANAVKILLLKNASGIYHFGGNKIFSPYEVAKKIKVDLNLHDSKIIPISKLDYFQKRSKLRLTNSTLNCDKFTREFSTPLSDFDQSLKKLKRYYQ